MKLYLSSYRLGDDPQKLVAMVGKNKKAALIANATDYYQDKEISEEKIKEGIANLEELGFESEEIDLRDYFGKPRELAKKMSEFGLVFVRGGNTFVLRRAFAESGFDKWLRSQKNNKELVYAGYSAGVCVLSPSLRGLEIVDDPNIVPKGYKTEVIWNGMGLIDFAFAPHYMSDHPESKNVTKEVEYYKKNRIKFKALHDGEVIIQEI
jgi:dipeptidase E